MKKLVSVLLIAAMVILGSCGTLKKSNASSNSTSLNDELKDRNRANISLLQRITQMRGVVLHNNLPVINKTANSFASAGNQEPLYVLNNQVIGNSFHSINEIIENYNVKKITILTGADAASYGSQGSNGVIKIVSY
ncbi:TonB-dependent receptor plug domain-containing protein [Maribacter arcticus]|jgi:outer membrane receptor protein involved in Fe transport|uniref:TonB-dependent receptor plug domain-containing protein n=1 Tax=Maribacter arcticus TaxID=561365 RepID=UPI0030DB5B7B|tara:strand:+ start:2171 stop:2578 length:408 start_codon:yes stop_codon:yes gene_type:complete